MEIWLVLALVGGGAAVVLFAVLLMSARRQLKDRTERLEYLEADLRGVWDAKALLEQEVKRLAEVIREGDRLKEENAQLREQVADLNKQREDYQEKMRWLQRAEEELRDAFKASISEALQGNGAQFLHRACEDLRSPGRAVEKTLEDLDLQAREMERQREAAHDGLKQKLKQLVHAHQQLQGTTRTLAEVLRASAVSKSRGDAPLRRVLEMVEVTGITKHVDFNEQPSALFEGPSPAAATNPARPDMVVHLPNRGILPVDAKIPMQAYWEAMEAPDEKQRSLKLDEHARAMRQRILELGERSYREQFDAKPDLVAMFVPVDGCLRLAAERDPDLWVFAVEQRVLPITLVIFLDLLVVVAYGWQQHEVAESAREIVAQGKELQDRLGALFFHLEDMEKRLEQAVGDFFGSLESRVLPNATRIMHVAASVPGGPSSPRAGDDSSRGPGLLKGKAEE